MSQQKRLTDKQKRFAQELVFNLGTRNMTDVAKDVGYGTPAVRASELQNPKKFPLVVEYIKELEQEKIKEVRENFYKNLNEFNDLFERMNHQLKCKLWQGRTKDYISIFKKMEPVVYQYKQMVLGQTEPIKVYLAEENRPYHTGFFKIGMTKHEDVESRRTYTDNPFGVNYICYFEYIPNDNFNLEKTLHRFFKKFSTKQNVKNGSKEWFQFKNRKIIIKAFMKVSKYYLNKFRCKYFYQKLKGRKDEYYSKSS